MSGKQFHQRLHRALSEKKPVRKRWLLLGLLLVVVLMIATCGYYKKAQAEIAGSDHAHSSVAK